MHKAVKFLLWFAGLTVVALIVGRLVGLRIWTVPDDPFLGASTAPTLFGGDLVIVLESGDRTTGDLVRCQDPEDAQRWVIGRIYGNPNDKVLIAGGSVSVNGKRYVSQEACSEAVFPTINPATGVAKTLGCARVGFAGGWHFIGRGPGIDSSPAEHTVGPGRFYLVSDNRVHHDDSRDFGAVPMESCTGKILFRLWGKEGSSANSRFTIIR